MEASLTFLKTKMAELERLPIYYALKNKEIKTEIINYLCENKRNVLRISRIFRKQIQIRNHPNPFRFEFITEMIKFGADFNLLNGNKTVFSGIVEHFNINEKPNSEDLFVFLLSFNLLSLSTIRSTIELFPQSKYLALFCQYEKRSIWNLDRHHLFSSPFRSKTFYLLCSLRVVSKINKSFLLPKPIFFIIVGFLSIYK